MRPADFMPCVLAGVLAILPAPQPAEASDLEPKDDPAILRSEVLEIDAGTIFGWAGAKCGSEIAIPWFDGSELSATAEQVEEAGGYVNVSARVEARVFGSVALTIGRDVLVGSVNIDSEVYHLRSLGGTTYSLVQMNTDGMMPNGPDALDLDPGPRRPVATPWFRRLARYFIEALPPKELVEIAAQQQLKAEALFETGERIDIAVAYTQGAREWAESRGYNIPVFHALIFSMVARANNSLHFSEIDTHLNLVAIQEVDHQVMDPAEFETDLQALRDGVGNLGELHALRNETQADLVALLVFNGTAKCGGETACGQAMVPRKFPGSGDSPGTLRWEAEFADKGFSVVSVYHAVDYSSFTHEIGHNLGAHHDVYTFVTEGAKATADPYARGWLTIPDALRTVMSYDALCTDSDVKCEFIPLFSNPSLFLNGVRLGNHPPLGGPNFLGPANNALAIQRMLARVASYRIAGP